MHTHRLDSSFLRELRRILSYHMQRLLSTSSTPSSSLIQLFNMSRPHSTTLLPPLLAPYILRALQDLDDQHHSLTLITYTLSVSPLWLLLRYLGAGLQGASEEEEEEEEEEGKSRQDASGRGGVGVVLASFVREWECWRDGARRMVCECGLHPTSFCSGGSWEVETCEARTFRARKARITRML